MGGYLFELLTQKNDIRKENTFNSAFDAIFCICVACTEKSEGHVTSRHIPRYE